MWGINETISFGKSPFMVDSFTAIHTDLQHQLLAPASEMLKRGIIDGIRCSTRPDAVGDEAITLLQSYGIKQ